MSTVEDSKETLRRREVPLEMDPAAFRAMGHTLVDRIADFLAGIRERPVTPGESPAVVRAALGQRGLPAQGEDAARLLERATGLVLDHSLLNGHPRFFGYITSAPAPIGMLGDLLAAAANPNGGAWELSPIASEIEAQAVRWIAELLGMPAGTGGLLVSGGNMANFVGFLAARRAMADWDVRNDGLAAGAKLRIYTTHETHTWIQKATDLFGFGTAAIHWIPVGDDLAMDVGALRAAIAEDKARGERPAIVVGTGGSVSTGAVDPLVEIAAVCKEHGLWFHVDGAYGALAAVLPDAPAALRALALADSVAVDPHKWLYAPIEAGCTLVRNPGTLIDAFSYHPPYYHFDRSADAPVNFVDYGPQNTRGFKALKVWLGLAQAGREGYVRMIGDDCALARALHARAAAHPELEAFACGLSISTFRFVPKDLRGEVAQHGEYLDRLNTELLVRLKAGGEVFLSNAVLRESFVLRACIVNFRTTLDDVEAVPEIVVRVGRALDAEMRGAKR